MKRILFSCLGTTDPVRGEHDGPMLHILRHYRPERAMLILTPEIRELAEKDGRFEKTRDWIAAHWDGYRPDFCCHAVDVRNAHDMDALDRPLHEAMSAWSAAHPDKVTQLFLSAGSVLPRRFRPRLYEVGTAGGHPVYRLSAPLFLGVTL